MAYEHGTDVQEEESIGPVQTVDSSTIVLFGTAPFGPINTLFEITNPAQGKQIFGSKLTGFTIPPALEQIFTEANTRVIVANMFDPATMVTAVASEAHNVATRKIKTTYNPIGLVTVKDSGGTTTYVSGTHYTADAFGNITIIDPTITDSTTLKVSYNKADLSQVTASLIVGGNTANVRTGLALLDLVYNQFGRKPKLILVPGYNMLPTVQTAMRLAEIKFRANGLFTLAQGTSFTTATACRAVGNTYANADDRGILQYGWRKYFHEDLNTDVLYDPTPALAGLIARMDYSLGYQNSPSSKAYLGGTGLEFNFSFAYNDPNCDATVLNSYGICCTVSVPGKAQMQWGNRNLSFPTASGKMTFISVRRTVDVTEDSIEQDLGVNGVDENMNQAEITDLVNRENAYIRDQISANKLVPGTKFSYDPADNTTDQISNGEYVFKLTMDEYTPAEVIRVKVKQDPSLQAAALAATT